MDKEKQDCINKAIELADGFYITKGICAAINGLDWLCQKDRLPQWFLDALAVQLKRQVDATEFRVGEVDNMSWIEWRKDKEDPRYLSTLNGRTINSLNVCVEFLTALAERAAKGEAGG